MNDAIDRLITERAAMDRGFPRGLLVSGAIHLLLVGGAIAGQFLTPKAPLIKVVTGRIIELPPGGGGQRGPETAPQKPEPPAPKEEAAPKPEPIKKQIAKPPKDEPATKAVAPLDSKPTKKPKTTPAPAQRQAASGGAAGGTGKGPQTPGLEFGPVGPGAPGGTDPNGDWYLAGVQRKIWGIWTQQIHSDMAQSVTVRFTITADGSVDEVEIAQSSGVYLLDTAAQRAVMTAAPFSALPKTYDTNRLTVQAVFKPTS